MRYKTGFSINIMRIVILLMPYLKDFRTIVSMCFKESAGKSFVERGEYDITNEESGALLRPEDWTVMAGMKLSMAIIIRKNVKKGERDHRCPACGTQYTGPVGTGYHLERVNW